MKKAITLIILNLLLLTSHAQDTVDVVEKTIKIPGFSRQTEYYGFAAGDKIIFNLTVGNKKELKDVSISQYPDNVKFADHTVQKIEGKTINVLIKSVYSFEFYNSNISGREVTIKIQRISKSDETKLFNTNVKWVNVVDTTYIAKENTFIEKSDTSIVDVINSKVRVHSQTNLSSSNRTIVDFILPINTIKFTYWIGVGEQGETAFKQDQLAFSKSVGQVLGSFNPLAGLAFNLISMTTVTAGDHVKYYFIRTGDDYQRFVAGLAFMQFKSGDVVTDAGLINYGSVQNQKLYIGLQNDNLTRGIDVTVKILAVLVNNKYKSVTERVPVYSNKSIPMSEN